MNYLSSTWLLNLVSDCSWRTSGKALIIISVVLSVKIQFPTRVWLSVALVVRLRFTHAGVLQPCGELPEATHTETKSPTLKVSARFLGPDSRLVGKVVPELSH